METAAESLFVYEGDRTFDYFKALSESYVPTFDIDFSNVPGGDQCQNNQQCLFDLAATGNVDLAVATLEDENNLAEENAVLGKNRHCALGKKRNHENKPFV